MDIENIKTRYNELNAELKKAVARMDRSDRVFLIRESIKELQTLCPHDNGNFDYSNTDECPYCGKRFQG